MNYSNVLFKSSECSCRVLQHWWFEECKKIQHNFRFSKSTVGNFHCLFNKNMCVDCRIFILFHRLLYAYDFYLKQQISFCQELHSFSCRNTFGKWKMCKCFLFRRNSFRNFHILFKLNTNNANWIVSFGKTTWANVLSYLCCASKTNRFNCVSMWLLHTYTSSFFCLFPFF